MRPVPWMNAVWTPSGAGAPAHTLPLPWIPLPASKTQPTPAPVGRYWNPLPNAGFSNPALSNPELTTCNSAELAEPVLTESPLYVATMLWLPRPNAEVVHAAARLFPLPPTRTALQPVMGAPPMANATVPVGALPVTVAVNV